MVEEAHRKSQKHGISVTFVIQPQRADIYDEFQKQINLLQQPPLPTEPTKTISSTINKGSIEVHMGDLTAQKVRCRQFENEAKIFFLPIFWHGWIELVELHLKV